MMNARRAPEARKKGYAVLLAAAATFFISLAAQTDAGSPTVKPGEAEFKEHCAVCHPDGENIITPAKTLHRKTLEANGVKKAEDIIARMRQPGPGMSRFDEKTVPDKEARAIAEYIMKTFK
jgi:cytochrome c6